MTMKAVEHLAERVQQSMQDHADRASDVLSRSWRRMTTWVGLGVTLLVAFYVLFGHDGLYTYEQRRHESRAYAREIDRLQQENQALKSHVDELQNDPNAIEQQAREDLHYTRPGEVIVALPQQSAAPQK